MLPSVVASELEQVAADAIHTAFHPTTPGFTGLIDRFLAERERLLKVAFVRSGLPQPEDSAQPLPHLSVEGLKQLKQQPAFSGQGCGLGVIAGQHREVIELQQF